MLKSKSPSNLPDLILIWQDLLLSLGKRDELTIAYDMVNAALFIKNYSFFYETEPLFHATFDLATDLEIKSDSLENRKQKWQQISILVDKLNNKYRRIS